MAVLGKVSPLVIWLEAGGFTWYVMVSAWFALRGPGMLQVTTPADSLAVPATGPPRATLPAT